MGRIPSYLRYLKDICQYTENISATALAKELGLGEVQVRKDLGAVSGAGKPKIGYNVGQLIVSLETFLASSNNSRVVIAGAGKLGRALLDYGGFGDYGLEIAAAFDTAVKNEEKSKNGKPVLPMEKFRSFCEENNIKIGIITVPANSAQEVCDIFVESGIKGIWCFAPCVLSVPPEVTVQYENMALSLAYLKKRV